MGCDIHGHLEVCWGKSKSWWHVCNIPDDRNYDLFGVFAGVRNYVNAIPISEPKGLPDNIGFIVKRDVKRLGIDGHSHSWLTWKEIKEHDWDQTSIDGRVSTIKLSTGKEIGKASYTSLQDKPIEEVHESGFDLKHLERAAKDLVSFVWRGFFDFMRHLAEGDDGAEGYGEENVRIVFWFDN